LERLEPTLLWQMGEFDVWIWAARWLGRMHGILATSTALRRRAETHLIRYDKEFYRRWINRACAFISGGGRHGAMDWLLNRYERVIERLLELPPTVIHGEFFVSNVLVANPQSEAFLRVCPVDWEMAAIGPGLVDLAALTSGEWTTEQRNAMAVAYYEALPDLMRKDWPFERFLTDIDYCRLHQAVQLLGWSANWSAPPEHAQDWVEEALTLARKLRL
jgi:aminoglycoside phosphotransferase (APT) family kinase protein